MFGGRLSTWIARGVQLAFQGPYSFVGSAVTFEEGYRDEPGVNRDEGGPFTKFTERLHL